MRQLWQKSNSNFAPVFQWEPDRFARDEQPTTINSLELDWTGRTTSSRLALLD